MIRRPPRYKRTDTLLPYTTLCRSHAGTVKRVQAAVRALTGGRVDLDVKLVNMVRLFRAGEPIKMSKRAGNFVTLADVVREVGKDVVRFMMQIGRAHV